MRSNTVEFSYTISPDLCLIALSLTSLIDLPRSATMHSSGMSASSSEEKPEITESLSLSAEEKKRIVLFYVCTSLLSTYFRVLKRMQ